MNEQQKTCEHIFEPSERLQGVACEVCDVPVEQLLKELGKDCRIGFYCSLHASVHGAEAEELRGRFEKLMADGSDENDDDYVFFDKIREILDDVDARDSAAFVERYKTEKIEQLQATIHTLNRQLEELTKKASSDKPSP